MNFILCLSVVQARLHCPNPGASWWNYHRDKVCSSCLLMKLTFFSPYVLVFMWIVFLCHYQKALSLYTIIYKFLFVSHFCIFLEFSLVVEIGPSPATVWIYMILEYWQWLLLNTVYLKTSMMNILQQTTTLLRFAALYFWLWVLWFLL